LNFINCEKKAIMSWKTESVMEQKERFIRMWLGRNYTMTAMCQMFGISRVTGYNLVKDYKKRGKKSFESKSTAPKNIPHKTDSKVEKRLIELRKKHKNWGARKLKILLESEFKKEKIPSETTLNSLLKKHLLIKSKKRRGPKLSKTYPKFDPSKCNEIWSADYKGKFKLGNGRYCYPLTVCDSKSRMILGIDCHYRPTYKAVKEAFTRIFRQFGLPEFLHTDNGSPFGNVQSICRFTSLSYWLIDQGVMPVFSDTASPQQNGRHERMHRDLKAYNRNRIQNTMSKQQQVLDEFREEYNAIRPHEALKMKRPKDVHTLSKIPFIKKKIPFDYAKELKVLKVTENGSIRWGAYHWIFVSSAARGKYMGMEETENGIWNVYYRDVILGYIDEKDLNRKEQYLRIKKIKV